MKKLFCLLGFSALLLTSCSSSDSSSSSTMTESDVLVQKTVEHYALDGSTVTTNYTYNGKKLVKSTDSDGYHDDYTYTGDLITKMETIDDSNGAMMQQQTFTYNSNNQLVTYVVKDFDSGDGNRETYVYNSDGTVSITTYSGDTTTQTTLLSTGTIYFTGGLVSQVILAVTDESSYNSSRTYTYDTKNSPFKNVTGMNKISFIGGESGDVGHNVLTDHYTSSLSSSLNVDVTTTYTYNSLNFPTTDSEIMGTDATSIITTQYTYN
ncbi:hypothetical protein [Flavobacterium sp.]|uniref:hypothetical protein n=1 Tax=Flavobacterium sp. TaxID=239 RepID=UPI002FD9DA1E